MATIVLYRRGDAVGFPSMTYEYHSSLMEGVKVVTYEGLTFALSSIDRDNGRYVFIQTTNLHIEKSGNYYQRL